MARRHLPGVGVNMDMDMVADLFLLRHSDLLGGRGWALYPPRTPTGGTPLFGKDCMQGGVDITLRASKRDSPEPFAVQTIHVSLSLGLGRVSWCVASAL